jgi:hypothetical protein
MKRICAILLCLCLILTGCKSNKSDDEVNQTVKDKDTIVTPAINNEGGSNDGSTENSNEDYNKNGTVSEVDGDEKGGFITLKLNAEWSKAKSAKLLKPVYESPIYEAKVKPYITANDLSNVENISQFSGFTKKQISMMVKNGFVVLPATNTRMHYVYDSNEYKGVPNFITSDSVLHLYHQFYDKSLMSVESGFLYKDMDLLTKQMLDKSILLLNELKDEDLKTLQKKNIIYFLVARMLMLQTSEVTVEVAADLYDIAKQEYDLIDKAEGYTQSPLLTIQLDYSQFTVRGHYTRSKELGRYFKTMMWFGLAPYSFLEKEEYNYENVLQALLMTYTTFAESEVTCDAELWSNIYQPTVEYVGLSDDIDVFTMNGLRLSVFGENEDPNIYDDEAYYDKLLEAVKELPEPQIQAELVSIDAPTGKQFRYMGQRYILDSYILQELIDPKLRPIPSSLDVMGTLGSNVAEDLLVKVYKPQEEWPEYTEKYNKLEEKVTNYSSDIWKKNLYNGWLWSLKDSLAEYDTTSGMPFFMTTAAWKYKALNTALGSYTELKHDTVLYGKQAMAEMGGPNVFADQHYVEPNVSLYNKLLYLTNYTISVLEDRSMLNEKLLEGANSYKNLLNLLIDCSKKELNNEPLTEDEKNQLLRYGGTMENITQKFIEGVTGDYASFELSDMLVSDIATYESSYLSLGTGYFDEIYVVVPVDGKLYLSKGVVYSFYEFNSDKRLTDEEWWALQGITIKHEEYADFPEQSEPSDQLPEQPTWINTFKSDVNNVIIESLEVNWDKLSE